MVPGAPRTSAEGGHDVEHVRRQPNAVRKFDRYESVRNMLLREPLDAAVNRGLQDKGTAGAGPRPAPDSAFRSRFPVFRWSRGARKVRVRSTFLAISVCGESPNGIRLVQSRLSSAMKTSHVPWSPS